MKEGEIDILEGVHDNVHNQVTWHTAPGRYPGHTMATPFGNWSLTVTPGCHLDASAEFTGDPVVSFLAPILVLRHQSWIKIDSHSTTLSMGQSTAIPMSTVMRDAGSTNGVALRMAHTLRNREVESSR